MTDFEEFDDDLGSAMVEANHRAQENLDESRTYTYECETCGTKEELTEKQAFQAGWDYPPFIGLWGVLSPRTCRNCPITTTAYWQVVQGAKYEELSEHHQQTVRRVMAEWEEHRG